MTVQPFSIKNLIFFVLSENKGKYIVNYIRDKKVWHCTCDSYKFKNSEDKIHCKHILSVLEWIKNNEIPL